VSESTGAQVIRFPGRRDDRGQTFEPWRDEDFIASHFDVSTRTVRRWRAEGMPSKLLGRSARRYRLTECERWHDERQTA
jgi:hypothetical protein